MPALPALPALDMQVIGVWVAALLTLAMLSAAFGENRLSRLAMALFIGSAVGYAATIALRAVLWPRIQALARDPAGHWPLLIWFFLGLLLLARGLKAGAWLSNLSLAYLVGVGAALAIGGAALGTALPQVMAVAKAPAAAGRGTWQGIAGPLFMSLGTAGVLLRFTYTGQGKKNGLARLWAGLVGVWGKLGYAFIIVALGALFAAGIVSFLTLLASRLQFLLSDWLHLIK